MPVEEKANKITRIDESHTETLIKSPVENWRDIEVLAFRHRCAFY
jgi:hypothetical protein